MAQEQNKVVLSCPKGPCAGDGPVASTDVVIIVREQGMSTATPVSSDVVVTLTSVNGHVQQPSSRTTGPKGELRVGFDEVKQGWYRALAMKTIAGKPAASAARKVQAVRIKGTSKPEPQVVLLFLSEQGVAVFHFVDDVDSKPLANVTARVRHPDGVEREHTSDAGGEIRIAGGTGEIFTVIGISHPTNGTVAGAQAEAAG
jgi:hypothetical protein